MRRAAERTSQGHGDYGAMLRLLHGLWRHGGPMNRDETGAPDEVLDKAAAGGLACVSAGNVRLTAAGRATLARLAAADLPHVARRLDLGLRRVATPGGTLDVVVDEAESPLAWLRHRRGKAGEPLISDRAFAAGERLRADFTRANLMPRMTADWDALTRPSRGGSAGVSIGDTAADSRRRVGLALKAVGPELSGVLVDVCCFLKPLAQVEQERGWPLRSAKLVLTLGLDRLAGWYEDGCGTRGAAWSGPQRRSISGRMA